MKIKIILSILFITFITGCTAEEAMEGQAQANPKIEMQAAIEMPHRSWGEELMDETAGSVAEQKKNAAFIFNDETVTNFTKVMELWNWDFINGATHDFEVVNQVENDYVSKEVIDILIAMNNGNRNFELYDESYKDYIAKDYISIDPDDKNRISELTDLNEILYSGPLLEIKVVDIDQDNEYEYLMIEENGRLGASVDVYDNMNGEIVSAYFATLDRDLIGVPELLEINNRYYILMDKYVGFYDIQSENWKEISVDRYTTDYKPYEFYSSMQLDEDEILKNVDLLGHEDAGWEMQEERFAFFNPTSDIAYPWITKQIIDGKIYYYVISGFSPNNPNNSNDRVLFLVKESNEGKYEIVKAYYLVADLKLVIYEG